MKLVVGLGNFEPKYLKTRHNVGFIVLDTFSKKHTLDWKEESKYKSLVCKYKDLLLAKPLTFMNRSGEAVSKILNYYKLNPEDLYVIHDDLDLPFGKIKKQIGAGAAGHHGVEDVILKVGTKDFNRVRIGIGRPNQENIPPEDWVLLPLTDEELARIKDMDLLDLLS